MARHLLVYWPWKKARYEVEHIQTHAHDASNQLEQRHIVPGDTLWYVSMPVDSDGNRTGQLVLFGRLTAEHIVHTNAEAQQYLTNTFGLTYTVRQDANTHVFAQPGTQEPYDLIDITPLAEALRFESANDRDRLTMRDGRVANPFELRRIRTLAPSTVPLLTAVWESRELRTTAPPPDSVLPVPIIEPDERAFPEGAVKQRLHLARERNRELVARAKRHFKDQHGGRIFCQVCDFDFGVRYGPLGDNYM